MFARLGSFFSFSKAKTVGFFVDHPRNLKFVEHPCLKIILFNGHADFLGDLNALLGVERCKLFKETAFENNK